MAEFILYDTCPTVFEKCKAKLLKQLKKDKLEFTIEEVVERKAHINREWNNLQGRFIESDLICTDIESKTWKRPPSCKKCPLNLDLARDFSEITTKITSVDSAVAT